MAKLLLVDRDPEGCGPLCTALTGHGHQVGTAPHGVDAVRRMRLELPDLLLIDQQVPAGGLRTAEIIRLNPAFGQIPILLGVEASSQAELRGLMKQGVKLGITGILVRPYDHARLLEKIKGACNPNGDLSGRLTGRTLRDRTIAVRQQIHQLTDLPTISPVHQQIIAIMSRNDNEVDMEALGAAIQSDQALTMRVMRIAHSAYYGFKGNFIRTALAFLGMARVRQIVQSATILEVFDRQGPTVRGGMDRQAAWTHSIASGLVMQKLARDNQQGRHFTAGLLHDVGKVVLECRFREFSRAIWEVSSRDHRPMDEVESEFLGITHGEIGQQLANLWQLPSEVAESIVHHHHPFRASKHKYLTSLVYLADVLVRQMELGNSGNGAPAEVSDPYASKLHVDLEGVLAQKDDLRHQVDTIIMPDE